MEARKAILEKQILSWLLGESDPSYKGLRKLLQDALDRYELMEWEAGAELEKLKTKIGIQ